MFKKKENILFMLLIFYLDFVYHNKMEWPRVVSVDLLKEISDFCFVFTDTSNYKKVITQ